MKGVRLARPQGAVGLDKNPVTCRFLFKSCVNSGKTTGLLLLKYKNKNILEFIPFKLVHAIAINVEISKWNMYFTNPY